MIRSAVHITIFSISRQRGRTRVPNLVQFEDHEMTNFILTPTECRSYLSHKPLMGRQDDTGELIQGTLEMLILKALARGPLHGYGVVEWIHQTSQLVLKVEEGALYPALHRLELRGLLKSQWGSSDNNRRAKFYELTPVGRRRLSAESQRWAKLSAAVAFVMQAS